MARDLFDVSEDGFGKQVEAVKEFTDREDPQEAFERKVRVLCNNWKRTYYVLCYYGIGGIGKTSFVNKLCKLIRGVEGNHLRLLNRIDCNYICYDFGAENSGTDKLSILLSLRKQLTELNEGFQFYCFDSAVLLYAKRTGGNFEMDKVANSLLESNPWLDSVITTVGLLPGVGWVSNVIQALDKTTKVIKDAMESYMDESRYRSHLNEIDRLEASEIYEKLHQYFIQDMRYNMLKVAKKPLIIFLDTYEKYIDTLNREINMITEDHWLRKGHQTSVIRSIPGILWVITGREKLYWEDDDNWGELIPENPLSQMTEAEKDELAEIHLEQHLLGDLSMKDATGFLKKAGIENDTLCKQLYMLTSGTPLFLDICVNNYQQLRKDGKEPDLAEFGKDLKQLISRYLSNMNETNREMTYLLACLGTWNDENVKQIAEAATKLRWYKYDKYKDFVNHSFIIKNQDGSYYMHETVRIAAKENADQEIWEEINKIKLDIAKENVRYNTTLNSNVVLTEYVHILTNSEYSYEVFYENLSLVKEKLRKLEEDGNYELMYILTKELFTAAVRLYPKTNAEYICRSEYGQSLCFVGFVLEASNIIESVPIDGNYNMAALDKAEVERLMSNVYYENGKYAKSLELSERVWKTNSELLGEEHPLTIRNMKAMAVYYASVGDMENALRFDKKTVEVSMTVLGENHIDTISAMSNLAASYNKCGEKIKALELREKVLELRKEILGLNHPATLKAMNNLSISYKETGEKRKALELQELVVEKRREILGENHPDTLKAMNNLANSYDANDETEKALNLYKQVWERRKLVLGEKHPNTLKSVNNLASFYMKNREKEKAVELYEYVYEVRKEILGSEHPDTLESMNRMTKAYDSLGEYEKAFKLRVQLYEILKSLFGTEHNETLMVMNELIIYYRGIGEEKKALELKKLMFESRRRCLGSEHLATVNAMNTLANSYVSVGENANALELREKVFDINIRTLGLEHSNTISAGKKLMELYKAMGLEEKADEFLKKYPRLL